MRGLEVVAVQLVPGRVSTGLGDPHRVRTAARYALILEGLARPEVRAPLTRAQQSLIHWTAGWLEGLGSPTPEEHCRVLFDYLDGLIFHQLVLPREPFDPGEGIRTVLTALLPRDGAE